MIKSSMESKHRFAWKAGAATVALVFGAALICLRIYSVNADATYPQRIEYQQGEQSPLFVEGRESAITVTAETCCMASLDEICEVVPEYENDAKASSSNDESLFLIVRAAFHNGGESEEEATPLYLKAAADSWANGMDVRLFRKLNGIEGTTLTLSPDESASALLPFKLQRSQFGMQGSWEKAPAIDYELVSSVYPVRRAISIGVPMTLDDALRSGWLKTEGAGS